MLIRFERRLPIILFLVFIVLTTIGFLFYQSKVSFQEAIAWEKRSKEIQAKLDDVRFHLLDSEDGVRGFIVTGNETYADRHRAAVQRAEQLAATVRAMLNDDQDAVAEFANFDALLTEYKTESQRKIDLRKTEGFENSIVEVAKQSGNILSDRIQASVEKIKAIEFAGLDVRSRSLDRSLNRTVWILIISSIAGIVALAIANLAVWREIGRRRKAEIDLIETNRGLERNVAQRTAELSEANVGLQKIGEEREMLLKLEKSARQEAEIANRLRDEFMATVSHELRTPLNSILGWARLLDQGDLDGDQSKKAISTIIRSSETQNRLIEDLMDVARVISGKLELAKAPVDIRDVIEHSVQSLKPEADTKGIEFKVEQIGQSNSATVLGDRDRLVQVFTNLNANAIKFSPGETKVTVRIASSDENVEVSVEDNGIGIDKQFLPQVFERFRQDSSANGEKCGLGLGLAIVRHLVELHGGNVSAFSEGENKGTTVKVILPRLNGTGG